MRQWSAAGAPLADPFGPGAIVTIVAWSPDGRTLAAGSWDLTVRLWR